VRSRYLGGPVLIAASARRAIDSALLPDLRQSPTALPSCDVHRGAAEVVLRHIERIAQKFDLLRSRWPSVSTSTSVSASSASVEGTAVDHHSVARSGDPGWRADANSEVLEAGLVFLDCQGSRSWPSDGSLVPAGSRRTRRHARCAEVEEVRALHRRELRERLIFSCER
jgi:hypothetical protein